MKALTAKQRGVLACLTNGFYSAPALSTLTGETLRATHQYLDALEKKGLVTTKIERIPRTDRDRRIARITAHGIIVLSVQQ